MQFSKTRARESYKFVQNQAVTKLWIVDSGTCGSAGTCGTYILFQKKNKEEAIKKKNI